MGAQLKQGLSGAVQAATGFNIASIGLVGGLTAIGAGLAYSVKQAAESQRVMTQTEAVIKSTGGAAGLTAVQIGSMADRLSQLNAVDDEAIQSAENLLLTFKAIKADAFEPATQAAIDLSVALKMDLNSAAMMIGKALEDPVRGMTALRRAGVTFTAEQQSVIKALVETGQAAKAQALILAELNSQVGGSAAAAAETYTGQMEKLKNNLSNVAESIGMQILPALTAYASKMNEQVTVQNRYNTALANGALTEQDIKDIRFQNMFGLRDMALATLAAAEARYKEAEAIRAAGSAYDYMIPKAAAVVEEYEALTGAYDGMIRVAKKSEQANGEYALSLEKMAQKQAAWTSVINVGITGALGSAQESYLSVIKETTPEIARLTAEIEKYQAKQGQGYTVTEAATTSANEYELATLKAAAAVQKLAEYTEDDALELAQLKVNADHAQESVVKLGEGFGFSRDYTLDYTKKIQEASGSLAELEARQVAAEAALRRATAEFVLQQAAASLSGKALLQFARDTGIMSEADYNLAMRVQFLTEVWDTSKDGVIDLGAEMDGLSRALAGVTEETITSTIKSAESQPVHGETALKIYGVKEAAEAAREALLSMPTYIRINVETIYSQTGGPGYTSGTGTSGGGGYGGGNDWPGGGGGPPPINTQSRGNSGVTINQYIHTTVPATDSSLLQTARAVSGAW